jgi:uncharacterized membrane protein YbhN (UPF0104 family)/membrane-associated phospholipid phosphatase
VSGGVDEANVDHRGGDVARLVVGALGVVMAGIWAQTSSRVDTNLFRVVNDLPDSLQGLADALVALGTIWCVLAVVVLLLVLRRFPAARDAGIAGIAAWLIASGIDELVGTRSASSLGITVRAGDGPSFPSVAAAVVAALVIALAPYLARPLRRLAFLLTILVALAVMYLGTGLASDVLGGLFLGLATGAAVHVLFGAPSGRPTAAQVTAAVESVGLDLTGLTRSTTRYPGATIFDGAGPDGPVRVMAFGRDQRDGQVAAKLWHGVMYKDPGVPVFGSRIQTAEHLAYAAMVAERGGVAAPHALRTGTGGPDIAFVVARVPTGRPLDALGDDLTDGVLTDVWRTLDRLHAAGVTHGLIAPETFLLADDASIVLATLGVAEVTVDEYRRNRDIAALLVTTAALTDDDRAIAAAVSVLGTERIGAAIPLVQPAALPSRAGQGIKHFAKQLKGLRGKLATATGVEEVAPQKIKRLSLVNIGMLAGVLLALAIAIPSMKDVDWHSVQSEFEHADWGWAALALFLYPLVPTAWATALMGCVNADLPFVPTVLTQLACSFLNLITPNGIGGTGLQLDYLHKQGVPVASSASAIVLSTGVGGAVQLVIFFAAAALTSTQVDIGDNSGSVSLGAIAIVAALVGIVLAIPKIRGKVVPAVKRAASDIWAVLRNPRKAMQLFGGDIAGNLVYPFLLGLCLMAFGAHLSFAQLVVVQIGAGMLGSVAPVPGGIGVQEAALTAGLTAFGIDSNTALATVLVFRGITFALPPVFGFGTLQWLRRKGYA